MTRLDRLVSTIMLLQSRRIVRAWEISKHFGISVRTVYRDINALAEAGVPIAAEAGEGYSLVEGYHLPPVMFTREEAGALLMGGKFAEHLTDASLAREAESAMLKIRSVLNDETRDYLENLETKTVLLVDHRRQPQSSEVLGQIQEAVAAQRILGITYYSLHSDTTSTRQIEPAGLLYYSDHWHLIAYCRKRSDYRDFRTDRIRKLEVLAERFQQRSEFSLKTYMKGLCKADNPIEIQVVFEPQAARTVREKHYYGLVEERETPDGVEMTFLVPEIKWITNWLLSFGTSVKVLAPESLKEALMEKVKQVLLLYQKNNMGAPSPPPDIAG
jgi:predicted DNA-binding transcriptional regulator YafY